MHGPLIVARMDDASRSEVAKLFADFDATQMPHIMGTRNRQLFTYCGLYFHVQSFDTDNGSEQIEKAKTDPRFVRISNDLKPFIKAYDPATWRSPADAMATRFYHLGGIGMTGRRVAVIGIEVLAPGGMGAKRFWSQLSEGRSATRRSGMAGGEPGRITFFVPLPFRSQVAAEIDFDPAEHGLGLQEVRRMDRAAQFAEVAARGAVSDSGIDLGVLDPHRIAVRSAVRWA